MMATSTALLIAAGSAAVGTGVSIYGQQQQAKTAQKVGEYNSAMANATAEANANMIEQSAAFNADQILTTAAYNSERTLQISEYNARATQGAARTNAQRALDVGEYNAVMVEMAAKANAERILQTTDWNASMEELAADYNFAIAENNAVLADMTGRETIRRVRKQGDSVLSTQTARFAKAGVLSDTGTPLEVMAETAGMIELNVMDRKRQSEQEAEQFRTEGSMNRFMAYKDAEATRYFGAQEAWNTLNMAAKEAEGYRYFARQEADTGLMMADKEAAAQRYFGRQEANMEMDAATRDAAATLYLGALQAYNQRYTGGMSSNAELLYGSAAARGYRLGSVATLFSGIGQTANLYGQSQLYKKGGG